MKNRLLVFDYRGTIASKKASFTSEYFNSLLLQASCSHLNIKKEDFDIKLSEAKNLLGLYCREDALEKFILSLNPAITKQVALGVIKEIDDGKIFEEVRDIFRELSSLNIKIALASNTMFPKWKRIQSLEEGEILKYVDSLFLSSVIGYYKPHQRFYNEILKAYPDYDITFVGDSIEKDVLAPRSYQMNSIWINKELVHEIEEVKIIKNLRHVINLI